MSPPEATKKPFLQKCEPNSFLGGIFGRDRSKVESERRFFFLRSQFVLDRQLPTFGLTHFFTHLRRKKSFWRNRCLATGLGAGCSSRNQTITFRVPSFEGGENLGYKECSHRVPCHLAKQSGLLFWSRVLYFCTDTDQLRMAVGIEPFNLSLGWGRCFPFRKSPSLIR